MNAHANAHSSFEFDKVALPKALSSGKRRMSARNTFVSESPTNAMVWPGSGSRGRRVDLLGHASSSWDEFGVSSGEGRAFRMVSG